MTEEKEPIDPKRLPLRQQEAAPEPTKQEQAVRALAGLWSRRKAEKIIERLMVNNLIDLRFNLKIDDPDPIRIGWWVHKLAELFPGITPKLAINTYERLESLHCLKVNEQKKETKAKPIHLPVRLTITQEKVLRQALENDHGFMSPGLSNSQTFNTLVSLGLARYSTAASQKGKPPYITPQGKYAIKVLDSFRTDSPDDYARAARADVNIMQLNEIREQGLPLGPVSPALDVSRARAWEDAKAGPESPESKAERIRKMQEGRDRAHARRKAQAAQSDPFEGNEEPTKVETPKKRGRPKGSKSKASGLNKKISTGTAKKKAKKKASKKKATKKKEGAPSTPNTPSPAATAATPPQDDPRRVRGQEEPQRIEGNAERKAAAQAALAALKAKRGEPDPFDPFED